MSFIFQTRASGWMVMLLTEVKSTGVQAGLGGDYEFSFCHSECEMPMDV